MTLPVVSSVPSRSTGAALLADLIRRSEGGGNSNTLAAILQQQHQLTAVPRTTQNTNVALVTAMAAEAAAMAAADQSVGGRRPPRIRRRRPDEGASGGGGGGGGGTTQPRQPPSTSATTNATRTANNSSTGRNSSGGARPSANAEDEPPPLISIHQTTRPPNPNTPNTDTSGILPQSLIYLYVTTMYSRCTLANVHRMCVEFNLWSLIKGIFTHTFLLLAAIGWFCYRGIMFFVNRATILQRLMTAHGLVSTLIAVHSQKWILVVSVGAAWIYGLIEVMVYEEYIRWKYGTDPTAVSQSVLYRLHAIPGKSWYALPPPSPHTPQLHPSLTDITHILCSYHH